MMTEHGRQMAADAGAAVSAAGAGASWLVTANDVLQLLVHVVAIVAGCAAIIYHVKRTKKL